MRSIRNPCSIRPGVIGGPRQWLPFPGEGRTLEEAWKVEYRLSIVRGFWYQVINWLRDCSGVSGVVLDGMHDDIGARLEEGRYHLKRADGNKCHVETQDRPLTYDDYSPQVVCEWRSPITTSNQKERPRLKKLRITKSGEHMSLLIRFD